MEFDKKTVASIVVGAVIIVAILVYFVLLVGQASPASNAYEETGGTCVFQPFTAQQSGTVTQLSITLDNQGPSSSGTLYLGLYTYVNGYSGGPLLTSGSTSVTVPSYPSPLPNVTVTTVTQPQVTAGTQYFIGAVFSNTIYYVSPGTQPAGRFEGCGGSLPQSFSLGSGSSETPGLIAWASGPGLTTTTTTTSTTSSSTTIPISVSVSATPSSGYAPLSTSFTSTVSGGIAPYTYSWTFGDSSTSSQANPSHTYQSAGTYLAQLKVTDSTGAAASSSFTVVANSVSSSTTTYTTTTVTTTLTSTGVTTITSGSSTFTSTYTSVMTSQECLILSSVPQCHLPNTPPGLPIAWATSNMSVGAQEITGQIQIAAGLSVGNIQATNTISNIAFSPSYEALQVEFSSSGPVTLSLQVPHQPSTVWADAQQITTWNYSNGILTVNADPSAITVFFGSASNSSSVTAFLEANWILIVVIVAIGAAIVGATARKR